MEKGLESAPRRAPWGGARTQGDAVIIVVVVVVVVEVVEVVEVGVFTAESRSLWMETGSTS
jgi:hypothetical protein